MRVPSYLTFRYTTQNETYGGALGEALEAVKLAYECDYLPHYELNTEATPLFQLLGDKGHQLPIAWEWEFNFRFIQGTPEYGS